MEDSKGKIGVNLGGLDESVIFFNLFFDKINFSVKASCICRCEVLDVFLLLAFYVIITAQRGVQLEFKSRHFSPSSATIQHPCGMNFKITGIIGCCNLS